MLMKKLLKTTKYRKAFSLVETIAVLTIAAMVLIATLNIHSRVKNAVAAINEKLDENILPTEILQRIAEDLDTLAAPGFDTAITIKNKRDPSGYDMSQLTIQNRFYDKNNKLYRIIESLKVETVEVKEGEKVQKFPTVVKSVVSDLNTGSKTEMEFANVQYNINLKDIFTERYLRRPPREVKR